jgi:general secretion pathway protein J
MTGMVRHRRPAGFTLLEMLVVLIVLGFLMVGLNQGVRTGLRLWSAQTHQVGGTAELDSTSRILRTLLGGLPVAATTPGAPLTAISFKGTTERVTFVGDLPTGLGTTNRAEITLALRAERLILVWTPHRHELAGTMPAQSETELLHGIARVDLAYWGAVSQESPPGWLAQWDSSALPQLIRVRLSFVAGDGRQWPDLLIAPYLSTPDT